MPRRVSPAVKVSSKIEAKVWKELRALAQESHRNISGLLSDAVREYLERRRVRPDVLHHLDRSIEKNAELARLLAR
jgi:predicted transcriptional regulator